MPEIPVESASLFQNSITELEQAESALELAWNELEKQTAETIAQIAKAGSANAQEISERFEEAKELRQQLQTQIKQARKRREFHLQNSPMAVIEWDSEGRVVRWSPMAEQIFGWSAAEVIGKYWHECSIVYPEDFEQVWAVANQLLHSTEPRNVCRHRNYTKDGSVIHCEWYNSALMDAEGKLVSILSFARDITEHLRTQEQLHQRQQAFSAIAENATDIIARFDRELRHLYVNLEVERATGKPASEFIGKSNTELGMSPHICHLWDEACVKVFRTGKPETIEFDFPTPDGTKYYQSRVIPEFAEDYSVETVLGITRDITEIKQVEYQLRQSEARFRRVVDSNIIGIFFWEINGLITDANQAFLNLVGYTIDDLLEKKISWQGMTPPEYRHLDDQKIAELRAANMIVPFEKEYIRSDGSRVSVLLGAAFLEGTQEFGVSFVLDLTPRKQAEVELQKHQELLESIIKTIPNFLYIYDTEAQQNIYANPAVTAMLGYTPEELQDLGTQAISSLVHPEDLHKLSASMQRLSNSSNPHETDDIDYRIKHKNGEWRWVHDRSTIFKRTPAGPIQQVIGSILDISARKQAEESLKEQNEVLQTIFDNVPVMLSFLGNSGEIEWVNRYWEKVLGWSLAELKNHDIFTECYPQPEYRQYVFAQIKAATQNWEDFKTTVRDGRIIDTAWANIRLSDGRCIGIGQDISDRKRAEAELQQLNETLEAQVAQRTAELETFFDALPDRIFVVEREDMRQPFVNQSLAKMAGFNSRKEMQGKTVSECFSTELATKFVRENLLVFESGETLHLHEKYIFSDNKTTYFDTFKIPLRNLDGEVYALIGTSRDITELVETKQALSQRTEQLEAANQELESFCYSVSHDLRAPLRHISGFVNALKQRLESTEALNDPKIVHYMQVIEDSSQKMSLLIDGLLALSRVGRTELVQIPIDLTRLVQTAIKLAKPRTATESAPTPHSQVEFTVGDLPLVTGDPTLLQQVFSNLIDNAVKFSRGRTPATIVIDALPDGTIFVKDNGVGFPSEYADRLFGAFVRLHSQREFEGTGIGLAIVGRIIGRHGGTIWAIGAPSQGATFYFKLGQTISNSNLDS
ncbi:MAG: PAS domain S-box protein [Microcoleus sp. PH2017_10_PVI_O_A]|uniref:PAS domain-containing sensor histidine kinase n=1 Tax=unclassified Microcoleus TaxID=2642155 RepID=UPI001DB9176A|nr:MULTISPECIES: PAS domain S-box protein [unclassified Microcoleus]TAE79764.1 MAG: PAS domain S-box protein [Oscillatoriales cyanobacterium]MCC3408054.1 PAS domain S-box protein [Microcoleus sp. PH2017_10_PVI_O_A]MCC3462174.1 PAS domain S-box protein [Microcoleus sp. PH2017_11_PCY_U_A]MCC3480606.1 PAS domain S-box protein [Microcoleus sp. PH2017_12_PCY_D_A]MCC3530570.1 PAS domain S-box protein [Microcoleus sp. PH2017_21_RUC_O_A]